MELRLPGNHAGLRLPEILAAIGRYRANNPAAIELYDLTNGGSHDTILPMDLLSLNALNAYGNIAMSAMTSMWLKKGDVEAKVIPITKTELMQLTDAELESQLRLMQQALSCAAGIRHFGGDGTRTYKLLHRLRPNIIPIYL